MCCISNDDIYEIDWRKSARTGYTKIITAAMAYNAKHKRRNQVMWQPTDDDRDEFVKTELEPMLRDVKCMQEVFPEFLCEVFVIIAKLWSSRKYESVPKSLITLGLI